MNPLTDIPISPGAPARIPGVTAPPLLAATTAPPAATTTNRNVPQASAKMRRHPRASFRKSADNCLPAGRVPAAPSPTSPPREPMAASPPAAPAVRARAPEIDVDGAVDCDGEESEVGRLSAGRDAPLGGQAVLEGVMMRGDRKS